MENYYYLNGRVNALGNTPNTYNLQKEQRIVSESPQNITSRNLNCTAVSSMFFSAENVDILQLGIRNSILNETQGKYKIGRQSDDELKIVMRSIYFQHSKNMADNIKEQVRDLNTRVIDWCVPQIITNLKQDEKYKYDISTLPEPLERSVLASQKGTKTLELYSGK
jgi:hypothetical protein